MGGSQQLLSFNPTTVLVVLLLGLMLGCYKSQRYKRGERMDRLTHRLTNARSEKHTDRDRWMFWQTNTWIEERTHRHINTQRDRQSQWLVEFLLLLEFMVRAKNFQFFQRKISNFFNLPLFLFSGFSPVSIGGQAKRDKAIYSKQIL